MIMMNLPLSYIASHQFSRSAVAGNFSLFSNSRECGKNPVTSYASSFRSSRSDRLIQLAGKRPYDDTADSYFSYFNVTFTRPANL